MIFYFVILLSVAIDQISKIFIRTGMDMNESIPVVDGIFHITYVRNYGAAFSILQGKQALLITVTLISIICIAVYFAIHLRKNHWALSLALALIVGGGLGNLIDRIRLGYVVDFFDFRIFPVFNIADICVCCGCGILILYLFIFERV
ncbi:MAG TPA: signal peptidase II [Anaerovoracaceae bacterium]|nr:signal peptidase II [Anaerovoracaceae bacterium]